MSEPKRTNLLNLLASIPPEQLVEGAQIIVTKPDGETVTLTLGERTAAPEAPPSGFEVQ